ncbi:Ethanolamine kinase, partial [Pseudolycoriella hygida]
SSDDEVITIPLTIHENNVLEGARKILKIIRPTWNDDNVKFKQLRDEFAELYKHLVTLNSPVVFCHNDLLLGNVIYEKLTNRITFIDYEYAGQNFQAFDIGNHFTEFAGVDQIDYSRYPSKEFQLNWLQTYLEVYHGPEKLITKRDVHVLYVQTNKFALASHFLWTVWALIQAEHSTIDFDFVAFAQMRYNEYKARKDTFLALRIE